MNPRLPACAIAITLLSLPSAFGNISDARKMINDILVFHDLVQRFLLQDIANYHFLVQSQVR